MKFTGFMKENNDKEHKWMGKYTVDRIEMKVKVR